MHTAPVQQKGFTLVEAIVAIGLFTVVMVIAIGALLSVSDASKKSQAQRQVIDNVSFMLEDIARTVRAAAEVGCATPSQTDCSGNNLVVKQIVGTTETLIRYEFIPDDGTGRGVVEKDGVNITPPEVSVKAMEFGVYGASATDSFQPRVIMTLSGAIRQGTKYQSFINLQTTVTPRTLDSYTLIP
jgi:type II secretory pathway pseudopilin PulG